MPDPREEVTIAWTPATGPRRRLRFEPVAGDEYERIEEWYNGSTWVRVSGERVTDVVADQVVESLP